MPRYYHSPGLDVDYLAARDGVDDEDKARIRKELTKHHPLTAPHRDNLVAKDGRLWLKKPPLYCKMIDQKGNPIPELVPWEPGSITFGIPEIGFFVVPPGGHVDVDYSVPEKVVKDAAPHLLTEAEYALKQVNKAQKQAPAKQ